MSVESDTDLRPAQLRSTALVPRWLEAPKLLKVLRIVASMASNPRSHLGMIRLMRVPIMAEAFNLVPTTRYKHLWDDYLVREMSITDRVQCYVHHHLRMVSLLKQDFIRGIFFGNEKIWKYPADKQQLHITLGSLSDGNKEGEISLQAWYNNQQVYVLAFTIVPGRIIGCDAREAVLITRLQGTVRTPHVLGAASKVLGDVPIPIALVSALAGICEALDVNTLACVCAERQSGYSPDLDAVFRKAYDGLMTSLGLELNARGYFVSSIPLPQKPMSEIKAGHKIRTKRKRAIRQQIAADCADFIALRRQRN